MLSVLSLENGELQAVVAAASKANVQGSRRLEASATKTDNLGAMMATSSLLENFPSSWEEGGVSF